MSQDDIFIRISPEEVQVKVDNEIPNIDLSVDLPPDTVVELPPSSEINLEVDPTDIQIQMSDLVPDVALKVTDSPDVIVLPTTGIPGPPGPPGPAGPEISWEFTQLSAALHWVIDHDLNSFPSVTVVDSGGTEVLPDVIYVNNNQIELYFANPTSGKAYLN
jgi:hypothetical protein